MRGWKRCARKHFTGPALGLPSLTFRAWYEAHFGADAFAALGNAVVHESSCGERPGPAA